MRENNACVFMTGLNIIINPARGAHDDLNKTIPFTTAAVQRQL